MPLSDFKSALVTGASSGIGRAVVKELTNANITTYALARRHELLQTLQDETGCIPIALDLRDRSEIDAKLTGLEVDILINNAGHGRSEGPLHSADTEAIYDMVQTNVSASLHLVRTIAPNMVSQKLGHIVMIGSVSGLHPIKQSVYGATKGAIHMLCQNLRIELLGTGIRVTEICPGRVNTDFFKTAFGDKTSKELLDRFETLEPNDISNTIMHALDAPKRVNITTVELTGTAQAVGGLQTGDAENAYI